jgi:hypothetical protein
MTKFNIYLKKKKSRLNKHFRCFRSKTFPQLLLKKQKPHPLKPIVTKGKAKLSMLTLAGRTIEKITYFTLLIISLLILLGAAFFYANQYWPGPNNTLIKRNFLECFYFCIVTFTSLGYGNITPIGYSRLVAGVEDFFGLFIVAILV